MQAAKFYTGRLLIVTLVLISVAGLFNKANAQLNFDFQQGKFLVKGRVVSLQTKGAIPLANIRITNNGKNYTCDSEGNFAIYVAPSDTLRFSSVGYIAKVIHVYDIDSANFYTMQVELFRDVVKLNTVTIYPFGSKEEFVDAFMDAKNINKIKIAGIEEPKYSNKTPKPKFTNPISLLYERTKRKRAANPEFKP